MGFDGTPIRRVSGSLLMQEKSGYICSPIAYSCRAETGTVFFADCGERALSADELLTIIVAAECRP